MEQEEKNKKTEESQFIANDTDFLFQILKNFQAAYNQGLKASKERQETCPWCGK